MTEGTILYHPIYGKLVVTKKAYSAVKNAVVWFALDGYGAEHELDGTETTQAPSVKEEKNPFEGVSMVKGSKGDKGDRGPMGPRGPIGPRGFKPTDAELIKLIRPLIPAPIKGDKGDKPTAEDLLKIIRPLIPKPKDGKPPTKKELLEIIIPLIPKTVKGENGLSAFEIAKQRGFKGTEQEWLDSLKGRDGLNGLNGGGGIHKIDDADDVRITNPTDNQSLTYDAATKKWVNETISGGSSSFLDLTDTPATYAGSSGKAAVVNGTEDGLVFSTISGTDEKVKYDASDPSSGYIADKIIAGDGVSVAEGTGANENKLVITNTDKGSSVDLSGLVTKSTYDAHTVLYATTDNTPVALTVGEQTVVGRATGGNITAIAIDSDLSTVSGSDNTIPSAKATKSALDGKQATLVSGTNIKTVNGTTLLGSGDLTVSASAGGSDTQVQFNDGGSLGGDAGLTYDKNTNVLSVDSISAHNGSSLTLVGLPDSGAPTLDMTNNVFFSFINVAAATSNGGKVQFDAQAGGSTSGNGGDIYFNSGNAGGNGSGGSTYIAGGEGGYNVGGSGGSVFITGGIANAGDSNGGSIGLSPGESTGAGTNGYVYIQKPGTSLYAIFDTASLATSDKTFTFPNASGTFQLSRVVTVTSDNVTAGSDPSTDYVYFVAGDHTVSLPEAAGNTNRYTVKNNYSSNITVDTIGTELVEGAESITVVPGDSVDLISDGTNWYIV